MARRNPSRRDALKLVGGIAAGAALGAVSPLRSALAAPAIGKDQVLTVSVWGGVSQDSVIANVQPEFVKQTGATIAYDIGGVGARYNKLLAQKDNPAIDVFFGGDENMVTGLKAGVLMPIQRKALPNAADVGSWAFGLKTGQTADTLGGVPVSVNAYVLAYNPDTVKDPITSYADMWKPEFAGKLAYAAPVHTSMPQLTIIAAEMSGGSATNIDPGFKKLADLRPAKLTVFWTDWAPLLKTGDVTLATEYLYYLETMKNDKYPIAYVYPKEKAIGSISHLGLVKGTKNEELAGAFMNIMLEPSVQKAVAVGTYQGLTNTKVQLSDAEKARCASAANVDQIRFFDPEVLAASRAVWTERLNTEVVPQWRTR
jgi:putative spermidine/putrescine transport system substrate-binding protein